MKQKRDLFACGLWVAAVACMTFGTIDSVRNHHNSPVLAWGVFFAVLACVPTGWGIVEQICAHNDDVDLDHIIEVVDALHEGRRDVSRLR